MVSISESSASEDGGVDAREEASDDEVDAYVRSISAREMHGTTSVSIVRGPISSRYVSTSERDDDVDVEFDCDNVRTEPDDVRRDDEREDDDDLLDRECGIETADALLGGGSELDGDICDVGGDGG